MPAKSWTAKYFPDARTRLVVHFGFEMADEFTSNTFPFRFTIPPASLDPSVPRPGPYLFHGGGMQNPQYPLLSTNALQFMPATSLRSTSSSAASSTSTRESSENSLTEGYVNRNRCPNWSDTETRFLLEIWRDSFPVGRRRNSGAWDTIAKKLRALVIWIFWVNGLNFTVKTDVKFN